MVSIKFRIDCCLQSVTFLLLGDGWNVQLCAVNTAVLLGAMGLYTAGSPQHGSCPS
jgi:hypothetical protein